MKFICAILCLISSLNISAQENHLALEVDYFNNIYTIKGNALKKYSPNKEFLSNFSDALLGEITSIDVSNPLRLLLFYKESNQILYLDQNLSPIAEPINLYSYTDNETQICCDASSGGFWIYNIDDNQAFQISKQGEIVIKSSLLTSYFKDYIPSKMIEYHEKLYFLIPSHSILILNKFGQFIQQIPLVGITDFCHNNQNLLYLKDNSWFLYSPLAKTDSIAFKMNKSKNCRSKIQNNQIYILCGDKISTQNFKY